MTKLRLIRSWILTTHAHYLHGLNIVKINSESLILLEELDTYKYKIVDIKHDFCIYHQLIEMPPTLSLDIHPYKSGLIKFLRETIVQFFVDTSVDLHINHCFADPPNPKISYFRTSTSQCFVFLESFDTRHMASHISEKIRLARIQTFGPILL